MADEKKTEDTKPAATAQVPLAAKDSGQTQPPTEAAKGAVQATEPGKAVTAADQAGKEDDLTADATREYVLKEGHEHSAVVEGNLVSYKGGDRVSLSPDQFAAFKDKFEAPKA